MEYIIRELKKEEYILLRDFLYEAIYVQEGQNMPPKSVVDLPELSVYISGFGKSRCDKALAAELNGKVIGIVWCRIMNDFGHIDNETPSLAMSLYKEYRGRKIGTALLLSMIRWIKKSGYKAISLSVQKENYAVRMYKKAGFKTVRETSEEFIMLKNFE